MAKCNNGILKAARVVWPILVAGLILAAAWGTYGSQVRANAKNSIHQSETIGELRIGVETNAKTLIRVDTQLLAVSDRLERMDERQEARFKELKQLIKDK